MNTTTNTQQTAKPDFSQYSVTVKTDCSYWGDVADRERANELARAYANRIGAAFPGINVQFCPMIGRGHGDVTTGPDADVCEEIDLTLKSLWDF